ncbi:helix-turn-helix domain-containing protein [Clostridiaceae bacterium 35-E11]
MIEQIQEYIDTNTIKGDAINIRFFYLEDGKRTKAVVIPQQAQLTILDEIGAMPFLVFQTMIQFIDAEGKTYITHSSIANIVGIARQTVSKHISTLVNAGYIRFAGYKNHPTGNTGYIYEVNGGLVHIVKHYLELPEVFEEKKPIKKRDFKVLSQNDGIEIHEQDYSKYHSTLDKCLDELDS